MSPIPRLCFLLCRRFVVHLLVVGLWATHAMICVAALWNYCFRWSDPCAINQHCRMWRTRALAHVQVIKRPRIPCSDIGWGVKISAWCVYLQYASSGLTLHSCPSLPSWPGEALPRHFPQRLPNPNSVDKEWDICSEPALQAECMWRYSLYKYNYLRIQWLYIRIVNYNSGMSRCVRDFPAIYRSTNLFNWFIKWDGLFWKSPWD